MLHRDSDDDKDNVFLSNEFNKLPNTINHIMGRSFMESPGSSARGSVRSSPFQEISRRQPDEASNFNQGTPFLTGSIRAEAQPQETTKFPETPFKSARDSFSLESPFFEDNLGLATDEDTQKEMKELFFREENDYDVMLDEKARGNSLDEVVSQIYDHLTDKEKEIITEKSLKKVKKVSVYVFAVLIMFLLGSMILAAAPVFSCNSVKGVCYPQVTVKLTDKSPAAKTALLTVREALKVLSYLAIDFGDSESDLINESLDNYYQNQVIDTFNVNTTYQLNFLGYCRLSGKNVETFCMRSYGFDILAVFVRDAGVQLGELTKTNLNIMGDSFAIAYELAVNGISKLNAAEAKSNEYTEYAMLLQKFSKGLGFLAYSQFGMASVLTLMGVTLFILSTVNTQKCLASSISYKIIHESKKWIVILQTLIGFLNLLTTFLIVSLTLEYLLRLKDLAKQVGIANVTSGAGFIFIWCSLALSVGVLVSELFLANSFRKKLL